MLLIFGFNVKNTLNDEEFDCILQILLNVKNNLIKCLKHCDCILEIIGLNVTIIWI